MTEKKTTARERICIMQDGIDTIVASTSDHPANTGVAVGVLKGGQRSVYGYGTVGGAPPAGDRAAPI